MDNDTQKRLEAEARFHDEKYADDAHSPLHYKFNPTWPVFEALFRQVGNVENKRVLEIGCGTGWITAEFLSKGAHVDAFDISPEAIEQTKALLESNDLYRNCNLDVMNAEELGYDDDRFDVVFGFAILHHLELDKALCELQRVMKPGGKGFFAEPLGHNPALNLYRLLTPNYRTEDERPLDMQDIENCKKYFKKVSHEEYFLTALGAFVLIYIPFLRKLFNPTLKFFMKVDRLILKLVPWLGRFAWYSIIEVEK